jgi:hypothetical protein
MTATKVVKGGKKPAYEQGMKLTLAEVCFKGNCCPPYLAWIAML